MYVIGEGDHWCDYKYDKEIIFGYVYEVDYMWSCNYNSIHRTRTNIFLKRYQEAIQFLGYLTRNQFNSLAILHQLLIIMLHYAL